MREPITIKASELRKGDLLASTAIYSTAQWHIVDAQPAALSQVQHLKDGRVSVRRAAARGWGSSIGTYQDRERFAPDTLVRVIR